jgi:ketosteroid isomerase-like protein
MSKRAIDVVRRSFDDASRVKDPSGRMVDALDPKTLAVVFESYGPEIEVHEDRRFPEAGVYRGMKAVKRYFARFTESFDEFSFEAEQFEDLSEDRVLVLFRLRTRGKDSGAEVEARPGWIFTVREGLVVRIDAFLDPAEARAAAGLSS